VLHKHRTVLGEKWFNYHLADSFLAYIGSRSNRLHSFGYAVKRCGIMPVAENLFDRVWRWLQKSMWAAAK
jgi:hypothetical protein